MKVSKPYYHGFSVKKLSTSFANDVDNLEQLHFRPRR
jgi:hypothetical protein